MNKDLMNLIERELAAFRERGGDDLVAEYYEGDEWAVDDSEIQIFRRSDRRKFPVVVQDGTTRGESYYRVSSMTYKVQDILGITCTTVEYDARGECRDPGEPDGPADFARDFAERLDQHKGQFQPVRGQDAAVHPNTPILLGIISEAIPADGSVTVMCNVVPEILPERGEEEFDEHGDTVDDDSDDCITFHDADGAQIDLWMVTGKGIVHVMDSSGEVGRFGRSNGFAGLADLLGTRLSPRAVPAP